VPSAPFTPTAAGTYRWRATYTGDAKNGAVAAPCNDANENVVVKCTESGDCIPKCTDDGTCPKIATKAAREGARLFDTAVVTSRKSPQPSTVDFRLYGPGDEDCSGVPVFESLNRPYPVGGGSVKSEGYTPTRIGVYRWVATYSGDAGNPAVSGTCGDPLETYQLTCENRDTVKVEDVCEITVKAMSARVRATPRCVGGTRYGPRPRWGMANRPFDVVVNVNGPVASVAKVEFRRNGRLVKALTQASGAGRYTMRVDPRRLARGDYRVTARITLHPTASFSTRSAVHVKDLRPVVHFTVVRGCLPHRTPG
jgi:hypothetical protein